MGLGGRQATGYSQKQSAGITVCIGRKNYAMATAWWIAVRDDGGEAHCHRSEFAPTEELAVEGLKRALQEEGVVLAAGVVRRENTGQEYNPAKWNRAGPLRLLSGSVEKKTDSRTSKQKPMVNKWQQERSAYSLPKAATVDSVKKEDSTTNKKPKFNLKLA